MIASGTHEELLSNPTYVDFTEESVEEEEEKQRLEVDHIDSKELLAVDLLIDDDAALSESRSFIEREAVEGGHGTLPTDSHEREYSVDRTQEMTKGRKVSTTIEELALQFKTEKGQQIKK